MRNVLPTAPVPSRPVGLDSAIGQIDLIGGSGEVLRSWRIRSPKCTVGSSPECSVQLEGMDVSPIHATLIFGKKHTLLRALAPTRIGNRHVREWLIDLPTEILVGQTKLVVHPSIGMMATVVHAERLIDQASRLCKQTTPVVCSHNDSLVKSPDNDSLRNPSLNQPKLPSQPNLEFLSRQAQLSEMVIQSSWESSLLPNSMANRFASDLPTYEPTDVLAPSMDLSMLEPPAVSPSKVIETEVAPVTESASSANLAAIEKLLESLQASLERVHETLSLETKQSGVAIANTVSSEFDSFGKTWFSTLNDQFNHQSEAQQSLLSNFTEQISGRFGSIDEQLNRFSESSHQHAIHLGDLLEQARSEQALIETRFQEVVAQRNELIEAVLVLRNEIATAFQDSQSNVHYEPLQPEYQQGFVENYHSDQLVQSSYDVDSNPSSYVESTDLRSEDPLARSESIYHSHSGYNSEIEPLPQYTSEQYAPIQYSQPADAIPDEKLAESLERAQLQIQDYNQKLKALELERESAQERVANLYSEVNQSELTDVATDSIQSPAFHADGPETSSSEFGEFAAAGGEWANSGERPSDGEPALVGGPLNTDHDPGPTSSESQLPSWFTQDEPIRAEYSLPRRAESQVEVPGNQEAHDEHGGYSEPSDAEPERVSFSAPDLSGYSDNVPSESEAEPQEIAIETDSASISERLQRMLLEADHRRGGSNSASEPLTSRRWSHSYSNRPAPSEPELPQSPESVLPVESEFNEEIAAPQSFTNESPGHQESDFSSDTAFAESAFASQTEASYEAEQEQHFPSLPAQERHVGSSISSEPEQVLSRGNAAVTGSPEHDEESIEDYMQRLLQRVRTGPDTHDSVAAVASPAAQPARISTVATSKSRVAASLGLDVSVPDSQPQRVPPMTSEAYVPRQQAPEQRTDLDALRELANSNARRAISRSDSRRTNSAFMFKLGITGLAVFSATALLMLNGLELNMPFVGMIAAVIVAFLWGYDCITHFKQMKSDNRKRQDTPPDSQGLNSIQVGSADGSEDRWRPSTA